jgi:RimJ/RimL family protein N-acetyltransferase
MQKRNFAIVVYGKAIGCTSVMLEEGNSVKTAELGYWLGEEYWGQGIATELVKLMIKYSFKNFDIERLQAHVFEHNKASARVLEKTGFIYEGTLRNNILKEGKILNELVLSILKKENK